MQLFWDYIHTIHQECDNKLNEDCSKFAHKEVKGLDWKETEACVANSWSIADDK